MNAAGLPMPAVRDRLDDVGRQTLRDADLPRIDDRRLAAHRDGFVDRWRREADVALDGAVDGDLQILLDVGLEAGERDRELVDARAAVP